MKSIQPNCNQILNIVEIEKGKRKIQFQYA